MNTKSWYVLAGKAIRAEFIFISLILFLFPPFLAYGAATDAVVQPSNITALWANSGEDKVTQDERRASLGQEVTNMVWDGAQIKLFGARNEIVSFNIILEAGAQAATNVSVSLNQLTGPNGASISTKAVTGNGVFDWVGRNIEIFYVRYLPIKGLSLLSYAYDYDERHVPQRFRRPWTGQGAGSGTWYDRPDHDKFYPDIAVPMELINQFSVPANQNQSIWVDVYIPRTSPAGIYQGTVTITENGVVTRQAPVQLQVRNFTLSDIPRAKTMLYFSLENINRRYTGIRWPECGSPRDMTSKLVRDRHFLLAHRHRMSLIDENEGNCVWNQDSPRPEWIPRLNGTLFSTANKYNGPGRNVGNKVFSIGTYGSWPWQSEGKAGMWSHSDAWVTWFDTNSPGTEYFLYLIDEPDDLEQVQTWSQWIDENPGVGSKLKSFATVDLPSALTESPSLDIAASWFTVGLKATWQKALNRWKNNHKLFYLYNGVRPATGSFATEDDGVALRVLAWSQYKKNINRWFFWESTYYTNSQCDGAEINVFEQAQTFGCYSKFNAIAGQTGWNYSNGDGVLFYPGTDKVYPGNSYNIKGPMASLRLKHWRRGIQDVEYLALAKAKNPAKVTQIINATVPNVLWEYGADDPSDPTYVHTDISWSTDPEFWELQRMTLADIIENGL